MNVVNLRLPSLAERPGDIEALAKHFAEKYAESNDVPYRPLSDAAMTMLKAHAWPGNVRELENTLHRAVLLSSGDSIETDAILLTNPDGTPTVPGGAHGGGGEGDGAAHLVGRTVADVERELIIDTLEHCLGNRTHAATILGISIRTLRNKLKQYGDDGFNVPQPGDANRPGV